MSTSDLELDRLEKANEVVYLELTLAYSLEENKLSGFAAARQKTADVLLRRPSFPSTPIRLLVLKRGVPEDGVKCELIVANLQDHPHFEALSYVWGVRQRLESILCCGRDFVIRPNLAAALRRVRCHDEDRILWVDAICINQNNDQERAEQVGFMGRIYAGAHQVLIWLGEENPSAFKTVVNLAKNLPRRSTQREGYASYEKLDKEIQTYAIVDELRFLHLIELFSRPWFERVWVIQEVAMANKALVVLGERSIPWDDLAKVALSFNDALGVLVERHGRGKHLGHVIAVDNLPAMHLLKRERERMSLFGILCVASTFKSTDPRDKLFALVGLGDRFNPRVRPDYTSNHFHVFRKHVILELTERDRLQYLARPPLSERDDWPSWVPDWTEKSRSSYFYTAIDHNFHAAGNTTPKLSVSSNGQILLVFGKIIDRITDLVAPLDRLWAGHTTNDTQFSPEKLLQWLEECLSLLPLKLDLMSRYDDSEVASFLRTFVCSGVHSKAKASHGLSALRFHDNDTADLLRTLTKLASVARTSSPPHESLSTLLDTFASKLYPAIADRQFLKTHHRRLGWVSKRAQLGDVVCVLYGGEIPFVLRQTTQDSGRWKIIGECYVDGLMQGEAMGMHRVMDYEFKIC